MKSLFVSFEGCEGSGKTSVIESIYDALTNDGYKVLKTREPGGSEIAEEIRNLLLDEKYSKMDVRTEALLFAASRSQHLKEVILPYTEQGYIILCDRYIDSSLAYQGYARGMDINEVFAINNFAINGFLPNLTLYIDVKPEVGLARIKNNFREQNKLDKEKLDFHKKVYDGYRKISKMFQDRIVVINGENSKEKVFKDSLKIIKDFIKNHK